MDELQSIWDAYGVYRAVNETDSAFGYIIDHTARVTLVDADGNLRLSYGFQTPVEDIVHDIKILLK
jgi:protein SCO1/2